MLVPESGLDLMIEQFQALPRRDKQAIMARLSFEERIRLETRIRGNAAPVRPAPYSADVMARIADAQRPGCNSLTPAACDALRRAVADEFAHKPLRASVEPGASLIEAIASWFRRFGR